MFALELRLTRSLFLKVLEEKHWPFYLQTSPQQLDRFSTGCSSTYGTKTQPDGTKEPYFVWMWKLFVVPVCS